MSPSTTMHVTQTRPRMTVMRLRLRSATPEAPRLEVTPPPNMSDRPPPRPLCSRMSSVSRRLVRPSSTCRTTWRISTVNLSGHDDWGQCRIEYSRTSRRPSGDASGAHVLLEPDDAREFVDVEAGAADE